MLADAQVVESESQELGERSQGPGQLEGGAGSKAGGKHLHWVQGPVKHDVPHLPVVVSLLALLAPRRMLIKGVCATQCQNDLAVIEWAPPSRPVRAHTASFNAIQASPKGRPRARADRTGGE